MLSACTLCSPQTFAGCEAPAVTVADVGIQDDHSTRRRVKERAMVYIATSGSRSGFQCQCNVSSAFFKLYESTTVHRKDKYGGETVSGWRNVLEVSTVAFCHTGFGLVFSHHLYEGPCSKCYKSFIRCLSILIRPVYL